MFTFGSALSSSMVEISILKVPSTQNGLVLRLCSLSHDQDALSDFLEALNLVSRRVTISIALFSRCIGF